MASTMRVGEDESNRTGRSRFALAGTGLLIAAAVTATGASAALAAGAPGSSGYLGAAESYSVLGGSTVTNTGAPTHVWGDVGVAPGTAIVGLQTNQVGGAQHAADSSATGAQLALTDAYNAAAGATRSDGVNHATIGGQTFVPGVYNATSSMDLTGTVILNGGGDANATWVFQAGSTLTTASSSTVTVINGNPCNVYWQVGSSATLGSASSFIGTVMANASVTAVTGATVDGRLLARNGAATLDSNQITQPVCSLTDANGVTIPVSTPSPSPSASSAPTASGSASPSPAPSSSAGSTPAPSASATTPGGGATRGPRTPSSSPTPSASAGTGTGTGGSGTGGSGSGTSGSGTGSSVRRRAVRARSRRPGATSSRPSASRPRCSPPAGSCSLRRRCGAPLGVDAPHARSDVRPAEASGTSARSPSRPAAPRVGAGCRGSVRRREPRAQRVDVEVRLRVAAGRAPPSVSRSSSATAQLRYRLVVGGHDVPGRGVGAAALEHRVVGGLVVVPAGALVDVAPR